MTSLHSPFMAFPSTSLPSLFSTNSNNFEALKQLAFKSQSPVDGYVDKVTTHDEESERQEQRKVCAY